MERNTSLARNLRKTQTPTELLLWQKLRNRQFCGLKFRRQVPIGPYVADFYCAQKKLIIEADGDVHDLLSQRAHDAKREIFLFFLGYRIAHITNNELRNELNAFLEKLRLTVETPSP